MSRLTPIGFPFVEIGFVDSSNNYAMAKVQEQLAGHGAVYFAEYQTNGKGQRGKGWNAEPGSNITMSCVLKPENILLNNKFYVNTAITLGCFDFLKTMLLHDVSIKWPNDLYWKDRKAGGILIENIIQGTDLKFVIAGIGINVNQTTFDQSIKNPVSIKQITGKTNETVSLAKNLCTFLEDRWQMLIEKKYSKLLEDYNNNLYKKDEPVNFQNEQLFFNAVIKGVNSNGELIVNNGSDIIITHGTYEWIV